jgi:flavodoxin
MRKRGILLISICILVISLFAGCGASGGQEDSQMQSAPLQAETGSENDSNAATEEDDREASSITEANTDTTEEKVLVVYFSATGNTERVAKMIAETTGGELFALEPVEPYTDNDLLYNDGNSRVSKEHADENLQDVDLVANTVKDWQGISVVYLGYPIWWGIAAWPVNSFIEANDFTGKTVIPFCTSASSGLGESGQQLRETAGTGNWMDGMRFSSDVSETEVAEWIESLN